MVRYLHVSLITTLKGLSAIRKICQITLNIKKNTFQSQYVGPYHFSQKNYIILTEKQLFLRFHSVGTERRFSSQKDFPKF